MTVIKPCSCKNTYQDEKYGNGMRVHNKAKGSGPSDVLWRCTVCLKEKS